MSIKNVRNFFLSFVFYFLLQYKFLNDAWFVTDELDIMELGKSISKGHMLYDTLCSQHMPFSYYFSALFDFIGFNTVIGQRIAFYILFALLWALIYVRYSKVVNSKALFWSPLFLCSVIQSYDMGTQILSEHLAGCGAVILLLEYLNYIRTQKVSYKTCIMISLAVVLTFGTIFISIYAVFFIGLGVMITEVRLLADRKQKILAWIKYMLKKYTKLIAIVAIPWCCLFIYYLATGTFHDFIYGAYSLNRNVYSKYTGGLGSNAFTLFFQPLDVLGNFFTTTINISGLTYASLLFAIIMFGGIIFVGKMWVDRKRKDAVIILLFACSLGVRGLFTFHGTAGVEVFVFMFSYVLFEYVIGFEAKFKRKPLYKQGLVYLLIIFVASGYFKDISEVTIIKINDEEISKEASIVNAVTDENEAVWCPVFHNEILMQADRAVAFGYPQTPWTWRAYKNRFEEDIKNPARVLIYYEGHDVWGNKQDEYAKRLGSFVKEKYTQVEDLCIYIRNDYYDEAMKIIEKRNTL